MADWEQTGKPGLIVGCGDGGVLWYRNIGTRNDPKLDTPVTLVPGTNHGAPQKVDAKGEPQHGMRAKVCVVDWNGDGKLDLLVGDFSSGQTPAPKLTEAQQNEKKEVIAKLGKVQKELQPYYQETIKVSQETAKIKDPVERQKEFQKKLQDLAQKYQNQLDEMSNLQQALNKYQGGHQYHGYVWLYLRKSDSKVAAPK
jgi:hypothetical protein